jgi:UDP-GlcNAc:undecaprenyl-phosphate GlcNAc-1-phosphate transferase
LEFFSYAVALVAASAVCAGLLPAVIRLAHRLDVLDRPGVRRIHDTPIPRLGGIGIFLGYVAGMGMATLVSGRVSSLSDASNYKWPGVALGMALIFAAGLLDDLRGLSPLVKFALQLVAAVTAVASGFGVNEVTIPFRGSVIDLGWFGPFATIAWILLITNAMNLIDGLDGLAGGLALIMTSTFAAVALTMDHFPVVLSSMALAGALLGFLRFNFPPARIFMGDGGSQFLGYTLAVISIRGSQKGATAVAILVPMLVLGLPILDLATTIARRALREAPGELNGGVVNLMRRVATADREHLHHNLLDLGLSPRRAALALYLVAALFALSANLSMAHHSMMLAAFTLFLSVGSVAAIKLATAAGRPRPPRAPRRAEEV